MVDYIDIQINFYASIAVFIMKYIPVCFRICLVRSLEYTEENWQPTKEQENKVFLRLFDLAFVIDDCITSSFVDVFKVETFFLFRAD